jgi:hypothetical protein
MLQNVFRNAADRFELCRDTDAAHVESYTYVFIKCMPSIVL